MDSVNKTAPMIKLWQLSNRFTNNAKVLGFEYKSVITKTHLKLAGFGFLNDTDFLQVLKTTESTNTSLATTQAGLSL